VAGAFSARASPGLEMPRCNSKCTRTDPPVPAQSPEENEFPPRQRGIRRARSEGVEALKRNSTGSMQRECSPPKFRTKSRDMEIDQRRLAVGVVETEFSKKPPWNKLDPKSRSTSHEVLALTDKLLPGKPRCSLLLPYCRRAARTQEIDWQFSQRVRAAGVDQRVQVAKGSGGRASAVQWRRGSTRRADSRGSAYTVPIQSRKVSRIRITFSFRVCSGRSDANET